MNRSAIDDFFIRDDKQKYELNFDTYGFESKKSEYGFGEEVTVYFNRAVPNTDYHFYRCLWS